MKMTKKEYQKYVEEKAQKTPMWQNMIWAFVIGGIICCIGQFISNGYEKVGLTKAEVSSATSITMIFLGALLTGLNVYDNIAKKGGAGTLVPITGFANSIVSPAMEFKSEGYILGMAAKMFSIAGPVIVFGTITSILYGLAILLFGLL